MDLNLLSVTVCWLGPGWLGRFRPRDPRAPLARASDARAEGRPINLSFQSDGTPTLINVLGCKMTEHAPAPAPPPAPEAIPVVRVDPRAAFSTTGLG